MTTAGEVLRHSGMRVAIVHDWLVNYRGSERVLAELADMFPEAVIYASVLDRTQLPPRLANREIRTTFIQCLPFATKWYQRYLALMPMAYERLDMTGYDLIISSSHACAKGVIPSPNAVHVCYCYTPMRYAWSGYEEYKRSIRTPFGRWIFSTLMQWMRRWDLGTVDRVTRFIACSTEVRNRIEKYYERDAQVVFPPVTLFDERAGEPGNAVESLVRQLSGEPFYLFLGRLVPYKQAILAVDACNRLGRALVVAGAGPELETLRKHAGHTVHFIEEFTTADAMALYSACKYFLFPGLEDFGITVVEAQAFGKPVVAFGRGGALDTVLPGVTGILFSDQTAEALMTAMEECERTRFDDGVIRTRAKLFTSEAFRDSVAKIVTASIGPEIVRT